MLVSLILRCIRFAIRIPVRVLNYINESEKSECCTLMSGAVLYPASRISNRRNRSNIKIGVNSRIHSILEIFGSAGSIEIGDYCFLSEGTRIWSASSIKIGDRVLISHNVNIHDTNSHAISAASRATHLEKIFSEGHPSVLIDVPSKPIVICNDVWIGFGVSIFKGVTIGEGAIIGASSMITKDVAPYTIVAGNPAKVIGVAAR